MGLTVIAHRVCAPGEEIGDNPLRKAGSTSAHQLRVFHHQNVKRFRGGIVFEVQRLLYHSTQGSRVIKKKKKKPEHVNEMLGEIQVEELAD